MGLAIASIVLGIAILCSLPRIVGWMSAADDEPLSKAAWQFLPGWVTHQHARWFRGAWAACVGLIFIWIGVAALVSR